jgi:hypothetical protein
LLKPVLLLKLMNRSEYPGSILLAKRLVDMDGPA